MVDFGDDRSRVEVVLIVVRSRVELRIILRPVDDVGGAAGGLCPVHRVERAAEVIVLVQLRLVDGAARKAESLLEMLARDFRLLCPPPLRSGRPC